MAVVFLSVPRVLPLWTLCLEILKHKVHGAKTQRARSFEQKEEK